MPSEPTVQIVAGNEGCRLAAETKSVAIVVDAMRMSAMICALLHSGVKKVHVVRRVSEARTLVRHLDGALLVGERKGVKPKGFDLSNSPTEALSSRINMNTAVLTTTTGAQRLHEVLGALAIFVGTSVNASSVAAAAEAVARKNDCNVVIIPAGRSDNPMLPSDEDWYASAVIASHMSIGICDGQKDLVMVMWDEIQRHGLKNIFAESLHGQQLISLGLKEDVEFCAQINILNEVPHVEKVCEFGIGIRSVLVSEYCWR
ncbi:MAG: 2-phosphosulfolactate phosphatase [Armatimonadota bacterium]|nr:2-phosphosulfolactate phosphatase [Armatimonadota bacterium]MCX7777231.1 2-phosphosulfolactate phosphatase [Armatimonadota bacterium]MDW8024646.1 2-phosphosulfolactate phosphatase [Armatimonadota bacterium]